MERTYKTSDVVGVEAGALNTVVAHLGFATVSGLQVEELPQSAFSPVARKTAQIVGNS